MLRPWGSRVGDAFSKLKFHKDFTRLRDQAWSSRPIEKHARKHTGGKAQGICSVQFCHSVVSDISNPTDCSTPGLPVHHQLLEFTQTHVH